MNEIKKDAKGKVVAFSTDVRDETSVISSINKVQDEFGKIDILVNNAGTSSASPLEEMTNDQLTEDLNLKFYCNLLCKTVIEDMKSSGSGNANITTPGGKATAGGVNQHHFQSGRDIIDESLVKNIRDLLRVVCMCRIIKIWAA